MRKTLHDHDFRVEDKFSTATLKLSEELSSRREERNNGFGRTRVSNIGSGDKK